MGRTPILVGVGQFTERIDDLAYQGLSPVELAAEAARRALANCGAKGALAAIDVIATTRTFEDSLPVPAPFGKTNNFPRSIARRLGIAPAHAHWAEMGGNTPQRLVNLFAERLARGQARVVLMAGAEAISTVRHLLANGQSRQWAATLGDQVEDHGAGWDRLVTPDMALHRLSYIPAVYALLENARRGRLQQGRRNYAAHMGELFAPLAAVAADNPYSGSAQRAATPAQLSTPAANNRLIAEPYPLHLVARDQVNQAAALLLTTVEQARTLGIDESKWLYLHGYADLTEREVLQRADLGAYPAGVEAAQSALRAANLALEQVTYFDFYSCFPIAVSSVAQDGLGLAADDPRGLTVTGGLPYFGGPGNNYSMHAIATLAEKLRAAPGTFGFVGANGGFLSKYSAGVYSTARAAWRFCNSADLQAKLDAVPAPSRAAGPCGAATIETATVVFAKGQPAHGIAVGRLAGSQARFFANTVEGDAATLAQLLEVDPLGRAITVESLGAGNRFTFAA